MNRVSQNASYSRLKNYLIAATGLAFYADRDDLLTKLIGERLSVFGLRSCSAYADFLADGDKGSSEMDILISELTIGETYFFRGEAQFAAIRDVILPDIIERRKSSRQLRIWSAGCANGAEPYSLAILLTHRLADRVADWRVEISATDLNRGFLTQAAEGKFRPWALRGVSDELKRECFSQAGSNWTILPRYRQWISFHHLNLAGGEFSVPFSTGAHFDLILCCNVMIYFAPMANCRLAARFHHSLGDGGWLVVGACEHNQQNYTAFRTVDAGGARVYQKTSLPEASGRSPKTAPDPPPLLPAAFEPPAGPAAPARRPPMPRDKPDANGMERLRQLADRGDWQGAEEFGRELLVQERLNPALHFYRALVFENLGYTAELERSLRQAIYLDRNFALAHYHLGLALKQNRKTVAAARSFGNVLKILDGMPDDAAIDAGPGVTVADLKELAKMQMESSSAS